jgi:hypothetical protein
MPKELRDELVGSSKVLVFTGLPGTGKSTLAETVATTISAPAFAGDWLMGAVNPSGALAGLDRQTYKDLYYRLLRTLMTRQLMRGQSAVLDCLVTDAVRPLEDNHQAVLGYIADQRSRGQTPKQSQHR